MKNTKKWFLKLSVVTGLLLSSIGVNQFAQASEESKSAPSVSIIEKNGFLVLDNKDKENESTIICKAKQNEEFGIKNVKGELSCQNLFDYADFTVLTKQEAKGFKVGDILQVTFKGDNVEKVVKNTANVENKVTGQKLDNHVNVIQVQKIEQYDIKSMYIDHVSKYVRGEYLKKERMPFKVIRGDILIVKYGKESNEIEAIKKIKIVK
jgi:hypothetical protein